MSDKVGRKLSKFRLKDKPTKVVASGQMSLAESLEEAHLAVEMLLNNNFEEAGNLVQLRYFCYFILSPNNLVYCLNVLSFIRPERDLHFNEL